MRVIIMNWKTKKDHPFEVFSNLKILCESYPVYNYNTLNNYLSKNKMPYENDEVRIERKIVQTEVIQPRRIVMVGRRVKSADHNEEKQNAAYWLSRPQAERIEAVTLLRSQLLKKNQRMNKKIGFKRSIR